MTELRELVGVELGPTEWRVVTQDRIGAFAAATDDPQWIHTDPARAAEGPFGMTIAHGFIADIGWKAARVHRREDRFDGPDKPVCAAELVILTVA